MKMRKMKNMVYSALMKQSCASRKHYTRLLTLLEESSWQWWLFWVHKQGCSDIYDVYVPLASGQHNWPCECVEALVLWTGIRQQNHHEPAIWCRDTVPDKHKLFGWWNSCFSKVVKVKYLNGHLETFAGFSGIWYISRKCIWTNPYVNRNLNNDSYVCYVK